MNLSCLAMSSTGPRRGHSDAQVRAPGSRDPGAVLIAIALPEPVRTLVRLRDAAEVTELAGSASRDWVAPACR